QRVAVRLQRVCAALTLGAVRRRSDRRGVLVRGGAVRAPRGTYYGWTRGDLAVGHRSIALCALLHRIQHVLSADALRDLALSSCGNIDARRGALRTACDRGTIAARPRLLASNRFLRSTCAARPGRLAQPA